MSNSVQSNLDRSPNRPSNIKLPDYDDDDEDNLKFELQEISLDDTIEYEEKLKRIENNSLSTIYENKEDLSLANMFFSFTEKDSELVPSVDMKNEYERIHYKRKENFNIYNHNDVKKIETSIGVYYYIGKKKSKYFIKIYDMFYCTENMEAILEKNQYDREQLYIDKSKFNINLSKILSEIYFQKKAQLLTDVCSYITPNIIKYGFIKTIDSVKKYFYILYENINSENTIMFESILNKKHCCKIVRRLEDINKCLQNNNIYHNDLQNSGNLYLKKKKEKKVDKYDIGLIDFGDATGSPLYSQKKGNTYNVPRCNLDCDKQKKGKKSRWQKILSLQNVRSKMKRRASTIKSRWDTRSNLYEYLETGNKKRRHTKRRRQVAGGVGSKKWANMSARSQLAQNTALAREMEDAAAADRKKWSTLYRNMLEAVNVDAAVADAVVVSKEVKRATRSRRHARSLENEPDIKECIRKCNYSCRKKGGKSKRRR